MKRIGCNQLGRTLLHSPGLDEIVGYPVSLLADEAAVFGKVRSHIGGNLTNAEGLEQSTMVRHEGLVKRISEQHRAHPAVSGHEGLLPVLRWFGTRGSAFGRFACDEGCCQRETNGRAGSGQTLGDRLVFHKLCP